MSHLFKTISHANIYAKFRPTAPQAFVEEIMKFVKVHVSDFNLAVDAGCGPGISTTALAPYFKKVHGYDTSEAQIAEAKALNKFENVYFWALDTLENSGWSGFFRSPHFIHSLVSPAEKIPEKNESVQLITVMQAVHWFNLDAFYKEVKRVLVPHGVLELGGYLIPKPVSKDQKRMDSIIQNEIYMGAMKKYWEPVRHIVDSMYRDIPPAFEDHVRIEGIEECKVRTVADYVNYTKTWSAYQLFLKKEPSEAEKLTRKLMSILMEDAGKAGEDPAKTNLEVKTQFFTILARKPGP
ncbi:putative methyltransferase DDB_G0268948 isoform X1 [Dermacentor albipictus]|uniref:putative methyltransferase DDB_G0268948 isoform X1 n=1 Tax=Dermacentor albipictus TaxID=60249 RepID=UPI0031FCD189